MEEKSSEKKGEAQITKEKKNEADETKKVRLEKLQKSTADKQWERSSTEREGTEVRCQKGHTGCN